MRHRAPAHPETRDDADPAGGDLATVREELLLERDRHLRTRAEFENYRRRVERDREVASRQARRDLLRALVDLADGFDRALAHLDESPASVAAGVRGMQRSLRTLLDAEGVTPFESVGQIFDPVRHEAVATVRDAGVAPGTVVDESARGYLWNGDLLRPAQVRVAS
jgi:molecular chaperone GrpE